MYEEVLDVCDEFFSCIPVPCRCSIVCRWKHSASKQASTSNAPMFSTWLVHGVFFFLLFEFVGAAKIFSF